MKWLAAFILVIIVPAMLTYAGEADVVKVNVVTAGERTYRFDVTLRHDDTGWDHYADKWEVVLLDGTVLGTRKLLHPHVNEQPFTRSLSGVRIPNNIQQVLVRAHDSVHAYGGQVLTVDLPAK
ncbi:MAG: hypothetical protein DRH90_08265 [Deltaproteobacteria bacterium]|nr:MAG: hypothetical protein DRH90_08265 [Deltaproteobacteria bacterium]